jgi:hypothetical protein
VDEIKGRTPGPKVSCTRRPTWIGISEGYGSIEMLNFSATHIRYEPYPLVVLRPALQAGLYNELCDSYPDTALFGTHPKYEYKLTLSEKFQADNYNRFIEGNKPWKRFHTWLKSDEFIRETVDFLKDCQIDLDAEECFEPAWKRLGRVLGAVGHGRLPSVAPRLRSRFEFSVLKADGGEVAPHTDTPKKIITLVLSMIKDGEWDPEIGGGLDVNRAVVTQYSFNWKNQKVPWEKIEVLETIPFVPNQCTVFVKTFNSLHSVRKMTERGSQALRKSVTIVIEKDE